MYKGCLSYTSLSNSGNILFMKVENNTPPNKYKIPIIDISKNLRPNLLYGCGLFESIKNNPCCVIDLPILKIKVKIYINNILL